MNSKTTGKFIAELRKEKGLTQKELADRLSVSDKAVSRWETGKNFPDIELFEPIARELEISISELICGERITSEEMIEKSEETTVKTLKSNQKLKKALKIIISILLVTVLSFGAHIGINFYKMNKHVIYHDKIYIYDKSLLSIIHEAECYIKTLDTAEGEFMIDFDKPFSLQMNKNGVEGLYFEGYTNENLRSFFINAYRYGKYPENTALLISVN